MAVSLVSIITERGLFGHPFYNLVAFGTTMDIIAVHEELVEAANLIQARFLYTSFLVEVAHGETRQDLESLDGAFAMDSDCNLFCVPFEKRIRLRDADYAMSNFEAYCQLFDALRGESDVLLDDVWEDYYAEHGLICFRLILSN